MRLRRNFYDLRCPPLTVTREIEKMFVILSEIRSYKTENFKWRNSGPYQIGHNIKSNLSLCLLYYAEACNEFAGPIFTSLRPDNTAPFKEMSQRCRTVGDTMSDLTSQRFEPQTFRTRDERVTARPTHNIRGHNKRALLYLQYNKKSIATFKTYQKSFS